MRLVVGRRPRQRSEHNGSPASRMRGIRAPTEGRVSRFSCPKIAAGGQASQLSKLSEIKGHEVFRIDRHEESQQAEVGEEQVTEKSRESRLRREIADLKRLLADKALEVDFFKGALQKVEVQRRGGNGAGEQAFT